MILIDCASGNMHDVTVPFVFSLDTGPFLSYTYSYAVFDVLFCALGFGVFFRWPIILFWAENLGLEEVPTGIQKRTV